MYTTRTYRCQLKDKDLVSFEIKLGTSDLFICAQTALAQKAKSCLKSQRKLIEDYIKKDSGFAKSLKPYAVEKKAPAIVQEMAGASTCAGVGPMAAVAGAIAEYVGKDLLKHSSQVIVENGGDIFLKTDKTRKIGIFAGKSVYSGKLALEVKPQGGLGICTSSGTVGPSLSFGQADAAVVICDSAILADAWATRLGNMVKTAADVAKVLNFVKGIPEIKGAVIIIGKKIGAWGKIKLVKIKGANNV